MLMLLLLAAYAKASAAEGGERGIRTLGTVARTTVFETVTIDRSAISPGRRVASATLAGGKNNEIDGNPIVLAPKARRKKWLPEES